MTASDGMTWLDGVRAALDEADTPRRFFFRDDDAGWRDDRLREVFGCFQAHGIPLDVAVIPAELTPELTRELGARVSAGGVRVHQHGYAHVNHELTGRKCEFGPGRTPAAIADDIAEGQRRMRDAFGSHADAVFTPPWNRCEPAVADTLVSLGFEVLSRDSTAPTLDRPDIAEVPVTVDWFGHHKGTRWDLDQLGEVIAGSVRRDRAVGVMLHHAVTDETDLEAVDQLLAIVASHPLARPITMMSLARRPAQAP
jgi:peptidoglycan/xylan/chitin deacetylase (PgdA/CDA1 family)